MSDAFGRDHALPPPLPPPPPQSPRIVIIGRLVIFAAVFLVWTFATFPELGQLALAWWKPLAAAGVLLVAVLGIVALVPSGRRWLNESKPTTRAGFLIFGVLPLLILVVAGVVFLQPPHQPTALRSVFLIVVCLLPATLWYLFLVTRKASLLNEFLVNLDRLGLLRRANNEDMASRARRIESYLQKFEAIYGDLPPETHLDVLRGEVRLYSKLASGVTTLSTATIPVMLSTILITLGWLMALPPFEATTTNHAWVNALKLENAPVKFAFLGAYFYSLQMLFRRYVLKDLGGSAYVAVSIRIILAVIGTWILTALDLVADKNLSLVAFVFGVFPLVVWQVVAASFKKATGQLVPSMVSQLPVSDLDGLTVWHEARLEEEDIENIPNMATADVVEMLLNTRLPPERIIDWTDQAILYTQLGPQERKGQEPTAREKLRAYGIRTATGFLRVAEGSKEKREAFDRILTDAKGNSVMPTLEAALTANSNLALIQRWRSASDLRDAAEAMPPTDGATPGV